TFCRSETPAATRVYTLSLHDALPISRVAPQRELGVAQRGGWPGAAGEAAVEGAHQQGGRSAHRPLGGQHALRAAHEKGPREPERSEEHTSELQSRGHLVCRLLLEKKK